ncbi:Y box binding protein 1 [Rhizophlyctis rosea]|nr:Y box binding protein 1 [Rhizophlyctis rosea]
MDTPGRKAGVVKFFNSQKGYGFIIPHEGDVEVFVHHTAILNNGGFRSLMEGEIVEFDVVKGPKGMQAANVSGPNGRSVKGDPRAGRTPFRVFSPFKSPSPSLLVPSSPSSPTGPPTGYITPLSPQQLNYPQSQGMPQGVYYAPAGWAYGQFPYPGTPTGMPFSPTAQPGSPTTFMTMPTAYPSPSAESSLPPFWGTVDASGNIVPAPLPSLTTTVDGGNEGSENNEESGKSQQPQQIPMGYPPYGYVPVQGGYALVAPGGYMTPAPFHPGMVQQQPPVPLPTSPTAQSGENA